MNNLPTSPPSGPSSMLERAAFDPNFNLEKFERLIALQNEEKQREAELQFNNAFAAAMAEIAPIATDANNPQTRSRYATYGAVDRALRPIYTKFGLGVSFTTEATADPNTLMVVGYLTKGSVIRRYQIPMAIETKGAKGTEYTTRNFATMAAASYGNRKVLMSMFGISVDDEPGLRQPPPTSGVKPQQPKKFELIDPETGEVITKPVVLPIAGESAADFSTWGNQLLGAMEHLCSSRQEIGEWLLKNMATYQKLEQLRPPMFQTLVDRIRKLEQAKHS